MRSGCGSSSHALASGMRFATSLRRAAVSKLRHSAMSITFVASITEPPPIATIRSAPAARIALGAGDHRLARAVRGDVVELAGEPLAELGDHVRDQFPAGQRSGRGDEYAARARTLELPGERLPVRHAVDDALLRRPVMRAGGYRYRLRFVAHAAATSGRSRLRPPGSRRTSPPGRTRTLGSHFLPRRRHLQGAEVSQRIARVRSDPVTTDAPLILSRRNGLTWLVVMHWPPSGRDRRTASECYRLPARRRLVAEPFSANAVTHPATRSVSYGARRPGAALQGGETNENPQPPPAARDADLDRRAGRLLHLAAGARCGRAGIEGEAARAHRRSRADSTGRCGSRRTRVSSRRTASR